MQISISQNEEHYSSIALCSSANKVCYLVAIVKTEYFYQKVKASYNLYQ